MESDDDYNSYSDNSDYNSYTYDDDVTFDDQIIPNSHKDYTVLTVADIRRRMWDAVTALSSVLSLPESAACILLRHHRWSAGSVHDAWFADEDAVRRSTGLLSPECSRGLSRNQELTCPICFDSCKVKRTSCVSCGHRFCTVCWTGYVATAIEGGAACLALRCPEPSCLAAVGRDIVHRLAKDADKIKYDGYLLRSYVEEGNRKIKWCPAPGCEYAVEFDGAGDGGDGYDVACRCGHGFCWNCAEEAHRPVDCETVAKWILKNNTEAENVTWILAYTKPCPKCKRPIEKNDGCMHMTCNSLCKFQFCWLCLGDWAGHTSVKCNRFKKDDDYDGSQQKRELAKKSIEKYSHYYERWAANQKSRLKALSDLRNLETVNLEKLSKKRALTVTELNFVTDAWVQIVECRRVLKWTYAYGYYLADEEQAKKQFFEYLQGEAEHGLERLHHCAEKELGGYLEEGETPVSSVGLPPPLLGQNQNPFSAADFVDFRIKLTGLTSVTRTYFENLVKALENGLVDVASHCGCSDTKEKAKGKRPREKGQLKNHRPHKRQG